MLDGSATRDPRTTLIADVMVRQLITASLDTDLEWARNLMERNGVHHLPILEHGKLVGVVSDRDVLRATSPFINKLNERSQDAQTLHTKVHQLMSRKLVTIRANESVHAAASLMLKMRVSCLPVVTPDNLLDGIVTMRDLMHLLV